ncbi:MAG: hypothetical protein JXJ22_04330 [Bacteroidales bacterium]|nr:hypothetical protein [Bacteroidales bacterium]
MSLVLKIVVTGILFIVSIITGFWLHSIGRPLSTLMFTVHKLTAIVSVIFAVLIVSNQIKFTHPGTSVIVAALITGICVLFLIVSGALLSFEKPGIQMLVVVHNIAVGATILSAILLTGLLIR